MGQPLEIAIDTLNASAYDLLGDKNYDKNSLLLVTLQCDAKSKVNVGVAQGSRGEVFYLMDGQEETFYFTNIH